MSVSIKCFMIEPLLGGPLEDKSGWSPHKLITGWIKPDTKERHRHTHEFGVGAMWRAIWMPQSWAWDNETEPHLIVKCPSDRDWDIDSRASNCTKPQDRTHRCWVRHGEPPEITVDKQGFTCSAGAGSIALPQWHGYLRNGHLIG